MSKKVPINGKVWGVKEMAKEMKIGVKAAVEWIWKLCMVVWGSVGVLLPNEWMKIMIVLLYKCQGSKKK